MLEVRLQRNPIDVNEYFRKIVDRNHGGNALFIGTVREMTGEIKTAYIEYFAYEEMAIRECRKLAENVRNKYNAHAIIVHRLGKLEISDIAVLIGVSSPHREACNKASKYIIDELKKKVPIWKKEVDEDEVRWGGVYNDSTS